MTGYEQAQGRPCHCGCYVLKDEIGPEVNDGALHDYHWCGPA